MKDKDTLRMNILLSAYACEPNRGSEAGGGWGWSTNLAKKGHFVYLLTRQSNREAIEKELANQSVENIEVHYVDIPIWQKRILRGQIGVYFSYFVWQHYAFLYAKMHNFPVDLVHHVTWGSLHGGSELWKLKKPFIWGPIGGGQVAIKSLIHYFEENRIQEGIRTFLTNHLPFFLPSTVRTIKNSNMILVTNPETRERICKIKDKGVQNFLDSGLPNCFFSRNHRDVASPDTKLKILWVGGIKPRKGLNFVMAVLENVKTPFTLDIVGGGPWEKKIPKWIERYNLEGKVNYLGKVSWDSLQPFYYEHDVFLFLSLRESFGGQILEAMACGLPIITLDCFGAKYFVPDGAGIKIEIAEEKKMIEDASIAIESLWREPEKRRQMGVEGYQYAKKHSWEHKVVEIEEIYSKVMVK